MSNIVPLPTAKGSADRQGPIDVGALFDQHGAYLRRTLTRLTGSTDAADDIVQEVFLLVYQRREQLVDQKGIRTWLYRAAVNQLRHKRRSFSRYHNMLSRFEVQLDSGAGAGPDEDVVRAQRGSLIQACVLELSDKQREVFVLYELEQLEGAEIASVLDISVNTVWSRLRLARASFRKIWLERVGEEA